MQLAAAFSVQNGHEAPHPRPRLLGLTTAAGATTLSEKLDRTFDARPGGEFVLSNVNGRITVQAWDQPRIRVSAEKIAESLYESEAKKALAGIRIDMVPNAGGLKVMTTMPKSDAAWFDFLIGAHVSSGVRYEVTVPRSMNVTIDNTNGRINITDVNGRFRVETTNGRIDLERCAGSFDVSTTNGRILADVTGLVRNAKTTFETTNGRITVALPRNTPADVDAGTTNGSVSSELPIQTASFGKKSLRGSINGGGSPLHIRTTNGSIEIKAR